MINLMSASYAKSRFIESVMPSLMMRRCINVRRSSAIEQ